MLALLIVSSAALFAYHQADDLIGDDAEMQKYNNLLDEKWLNLKGMPIIGPVIVDAVFDVAKQHKLLVKQSLEASKMLIPIHFQTCYLFIPLGYFLRKSFKSIKTLGSAIEVEGVLRFHKTSKTIGKTVFWSFRKS